MCWYKKHKNDACHLIDMQALRKRSLGMENKNTVLNLSCRSVMLRLKKQLHGFIRALRASTPDPLSATEDRMINRFILSAGLIILGIAVISAYF